MVDRGTRLQPTAPPRMKHARRRRSPSWKRTLRKYRLYRILKKDNLFAVAFLCVLVLVLGIGGSVMKWWRTSPPDFRYNAIKVSVIDLIQTWSLSRSARQAEAAGDHEAALRCWHAAGANNPGDPVPQRGILENLRSIPEMRPEYLNVSIGTANWLGALTRTNPTDAMLAADVLERQGVPEMAINHLAKFPPGGNDPLDRLRARCLVVAGPTRFAEFERLWKDNAPRWDAVDGTLARVHDAWRMATDNQTQGGEAAARLRAALLQKGDPGLEAARLLQMAAGVRGQADDLALAIQRLEQGQAKCLPRYGRLWMLLHASGRTAEARAQANSIQLVTRNPVIAAEYLDALGLLGLPENATAFAELKLADFGMAAPFWRAYFDLLIESRNWDELRRVASSAKVRTSPREPLHLEVIYAEFVANHAQKRARDASASAAELAQLRLETPETLARIASGLRFRGQATAALSLLRSHETTFPTTESYWNELFQTGFALRDTEILKRSSEELFRLRPGSAACRNNRAALLLISGENPSEALQLTLEGLAQNPSSIVLRINRAIALLQNQRAQEAGPLLDGIDPTRLSPEIANNYHYVRALTHAALNHPEQARLSARQVRQESLFPEQVRRLAEAIPDSP